MIYQFREGARVPPSVTPKETYEALETIRAAYGDLNAQLVAHEVEHKGGPKHPLGAWFTWDETEAMHKLHLIEAGTAIRAVKVHKLEPEQKTPVRAYVLVHEEGEAQSYRPFAEVRGDRVKANQILDQIDREVASLRRKEDELRALLRLV